MSEAHDQQTYRRGAGAAVVGLVVQIVLTIGTGVLAGYSGNLALGLETWHLMMGIPVWVILLMIYNQHRQERVEALEVERLSADGQRLFDTGADALSGARQRLAVLYKWGLGGVTIVVSIVLVLINAVWLWLLVRSEPRELGISVGEALAKHVFASEDVSVLIVLVSTAAAAFLSFIVARYVAGMTKVGPWRLLRGGASYLVGNFVIVLLIFLGTLFAYFGQTQVLAWTTLVATGLTALLGLEIILLLLLGLYRPRKQGEMPRSAFESRLLSPLTSPVSIAQIINETINYQFGFEVSKSWFYRLLGKAITPLTIFAIVVLLGLSCVAMVQQHERAVVLRFGAIVDEVGPGMHFTWPWPVGEVRRYPVQRVQQVQIGSIVTKHDESGQEVPILWTRPHVEGEEQYMVCAPMTTSLGVLDRRDEDVDAAVTGKSLVAAEITLQYVIEDLTAYVRSSEQPEALVKSFAERRLNAFFARRDIDTLLTLDTRNAERELIDQIQGDLSDPALNVGVKVVSVLIQNVHPPQAEEVALAHEELISAQQEADAAVREAQRYFIEVLTQAGGLEADRRAIEGDARAMHADILAGLEYAGAWPRVLRLDAQLTEVKRLEDELASAVEDEDDARAGALEQRLAQSRRALDEMMLEVQGESAVKLNKARAERWQLPLKSEADAMAFLAEYEAYRRAPGYFVAERLYEMLRERATDVRKLIVPGAKDPTIRIDMTELIGGGAGSAFTRPR